MKSFSNNFIKPFIKGMGYVSICEIGSRFGDNIDNIVDLKNVKAVIIDPCVHADLVHKYKNISSVKLYEGLSLEILPVIDEKFDCILIDGDHNWYTVYNELKIISYRNLLKDGGVIMLHDVGWPYGRRDLYYDPKTIPDEFRHRNKQKGIILGHSDLSETGGANKDLFNAIHEGGDKNGVLTAVEDFLDEQKNTDYEFFKIEKQYGVGILGYKIQKPKRLMFLRFKMLAKIIDAKYFLWKNFLSSRRTDAF